MRNYHTVPFDGKVPEFKEGYILLISYDTPNCPLGTLDYFHGYNGKWYITILTNMMKSFSSKTDDEIDESCILTEWYLSRGLMTNHKVHYIPL